MNFKPTLWKTIVAILAVPALIFYHGGKMHCDSPNGCLRAILEPGIFWGVIILVIIYVIWSLIEKKK